MVQEFHFLKIDSSRSNSSDPTGSGVCSARRISLASVALLPQNEATSRPI